MYQADDGLARNKERMKLYCGERASLCASQESSHDCLLGMGAVVLGSARRVMGWRREAGGDED